MADVDVLRYVITGDTKGLQSALNEADQTTTRAAQKISGQTTGIGNSIGRAFSVKQRSLIDGINGSIIGMASSMVPLGASSRLAAAGLSQVFGMLSMFGGTTLTVVAALASLAAVFALTSKNSKEAEEAFEKNVKTLQQMAEGIGPAAIAAQEILASETRKATDAIIEQTQKIVALRKSIAEAAMRLGVVNQDALKRMVAETMKLAELTAKLDLVSGRREAAKQEAERMDAAQKKALENQKAIADARKRAEDDYWTEHIARDDEERARIMGALKARYEMQKQQQQKLKDDQVKAFNLLIDNSHRLASEFGRFMGAAVENFVHTMIEGIATIGGNLKALRAGGIAGLAGGAGLIGTAFSIVGSIVDLFKSSSEALVDSQGELIKTIKEWITSIRGDTSASLKAQREGIEAAKAGKILPGQAGRDAYLLAFKEASARFEALPVGQRSPEKFAELMAQVFNEMLAAINLQLEVFKSVDKKLSVGDVKNILTKTQKLDFQQGKDLIDFYSRQSDLSAADQIELLETLRTLLGDNITVQQLEDLTLSIKDLKEQTGDVSETGGKQIQITRSVASITENQANLVVGNLSTMNAVIQSIYELMQRAMDNFIGAASGIPLASGGGVTFEAGSIVIESSAQNGKQLAEEFTTSLRAKGVKV